MFSATLLSNKKVLVLLCAGVILIVATILNYLHENSHNSEQVGNTELEPEIEKPTAINSELLEPYTEKALRYEVNNPRESDTNTITQILYRSRWNASKDPLKYGARDTNLREKYKPIIGEKKVWAIRHLAEHDERHGYHEIRQ